MKKTAVSIMLLMSMTLAFASEKGNVTAYEEARVINVNVNSLGHTLTLSTEQYEDVREAEQTLLRDMRRAAKAQGEKGDTLMKKAVYKNLAIMRQVLNAEQYRKYVMLLNVTLSNKGISL